MEKTKTASGSKISWLAMPGYRPETWNPLIGCSPVSPGCRNCWAAREEDTRFAHLRRCGRDRRPLEEEYFWRGPVVQPDKELEKPLHWRDPRAVFVCPRSDLFHNFVPDDFAEYLWGIMRTCSRHRFVVLTKRPRVLRRIVGEFVESRYAGRVEDYLADFAHVWLMVSAEDQERADERVPVLLDTPAAVRGVSIEPMLGPVDVTRWCEGTPALNWVIVGAEKLAGGRPGRPCDPEWIDAIQTETDTALFVKQMEIDGRVTEDPSRFPLCARMREFPEIKTGLFGRPESRAANTNQKGSRA